MIVRRLKTFLAQLSQRIARAVATLRAQWSGQRARTAATMPQAGSAAPPRAPIAPYRPGSNWLEDARRLRGRPTPRPRRTGPSPHQAPRRTTAPKPSAACC